MSVQLYVGHTGQRLRLDPVITTLDALKSWIDNKTSVSPKAQILLTATGKQIRSQSLLNERELFLFDSKLFTGNAAPPQSTSEFDPFQPTAAPESIADLEDLSSWRSLFSQRKSWAQSILTTCTNQAEEADRLLDESHVISRSVAVAVASLLQHVRSGEKKYNTVATWADEVLRDQEAHVNSWESNLDSLQNVPARAEFKRFINPTDSDGRRSSQTSGLTTLQSFVDVAKVRSAALAAQRVRDDLNNRLSAMNKQLNAASTDSDELSRAVDHFQATNQLEGGESEPTQLRKEIEMIVRKLGSDLQHVQSLAQSSHAVASVSKMALLHTRNHIPSLLDYCSEMNELCQRTQERRLEAATAAYDFMRSLSEVESRLASLYSEATSFSISDENQEDIAALIVVSRLPSAYGQLIVESTRRREWVAKMKRDSAVLQEEMAAYQDEEEKRRRKWARSVEDVVSLEAIEATRALGIELSLQNEGGSWPTVSRQDLVEYLGVLTNVYGAGPMVEEMDLAIKELDKPTRKQIKRAKAFKNGSMHETAFGDTSLLLRGEEQHKAMRDSNVRLEEDLKASKSRIRKLEDLLYRQTQNSRTTSTGEPFSRNGLGERRITPPHFPSSQLSGDLSPSNSARHRRLSSNLGIEEKKLARRVVDLEAELQSFRDEAQSRKNSDAETQKRMEDAVSTKKDLMDNMEAQQREFAIERRGLEVELREAKDKLEEIEAEIERMVGSRDDERNGLGARFATLDAEVKQLKEDASGHAARAATEQESRVRMEDRLRVAESARSSAEEELQRIRLGQELTREAENDQIERLAAAFTHLAAEKPIPNTMAGIAIALEDLARRSSAHAKDLAEAVAFAKSEATSYKLLSESQKVELMTAARKRVDVEDEVRRNRERLSTEEARTASLRAQLNDEQEQLRSLRSKFAEGETGSEVLRQRVSEEELRAGKLSSQLAEAQTRVNSLNAETARLLSDKQVTQSQLAITLSHLEKRGTRAKEVSHKLYVQNARICRLLDRLGLAVTYNDDTMLIERASKLNASTTINDANLVLSRTTSRTSPPPTRKSSASEDSSDLSMIRWGNAQSSEEEIAQYEAFSQHLSRFNIDTIADAIVKRVRDFEYTAKKYNKESKEATKRADAYKDRSLRLRSEAHSKLAVRDFKDGDLALFLPTRGQSKGAWAAFNIGCPHYFLAEKEGMRLGSRDFIVARISKVEQKVVDLSKSHVTDGRSMESEAQSFEDDNPFDLSDGLTWWMVHAAEERMGGAGAAPTTPGLSKSTVAAVNVDARGSVRVKRSSKGDDASKHLNKSLDSRRSSSGSKKSVAGAIVTTIANAGTATAETLAARHRSGSQTSLRPPPLASGGLAQQQVGQANGLASGLGIIASTPQLEERPIHDQIRKLSTQPAPRAQSSSPAKSERQARPSSPSKSITSLRQHLETSPTRSPAKANGKGWNNIFSADITLLSPSKRDKS